MSELGWIVRRVTINAGEETDDRFERSEALRAQIEAHPAKPAHRRWESVRMVHSALLWNEDFLSKHIDFSGPDGGERAMSYMGMGRAQREAMQGFWLFLFLFLANYTSMNSTLVDHVRGLMANYKGTDFARQEEVRRKILGYAPVAVFLKDLRNFISHVTTPPLAFQMSFKQGQEATFEAQLKTADLLRSGRFSAGSKTYMDDRDAIAVADAVADYATLREEYYVWLFEQFEVLHGDDIRDHDRLVTEQRAIYGVPDAEN